MRENGPYFYLTMVVAFFVAVLVSSCGPEPPTEVVQELDFRVDEDLLADPVELAWADLSFCPPSFWTETTRSEEASDALTTDFRSDSEVQSPANYTVQHVFTEPMSGASLVVTRITSLREGGSIIDKYVDYLDLTLPASARVDSFLKEGIFFYQYLISERNRVNFKLITVAGVNELVQFDFIVPKDVYPQFIQTIESSIGAILRTQPNA